MTRFDTFIEDATALVRHLPDRDDVAEQINWLLSLIADAERTIEDLKNELGAYGGTD